MRGRSYRRAPTQAKPKTWYQRDEGERLAQDRDRIASVFPGLSYRIDEQAGRVFLEGTITLEAECGISTPIQVRVEFPDDYPEHEPRVYDAAQRFPHEADRHFYPDGRCCLWLPPESRWNEKDPDGLCRFLEEVAVFLDQQLTYEAVGKGRWPGRQRGHGDAGYVEFVLDDAGEQIRSSAEYPLSLRQWNEVQAVSPACCGGDQPKSWLGKTLRDIWSLVYECFDGHKVKTLPIWVNTGEREAGGMLEIHGRMRAMYGVRMVLSTRRFRLMKDRVL